MSRSEFGTLLCGGDWEKAKPLAPFAEEVLSFLSDLSALLMKTPAARPYPDVITFAFFCRRAHLEQLRSQYQDALDNRLGRGLAFHIAPSNVPINFAYSLAAALLAGNACVVKASSQDFPQTRIVCAAMKQLLEGAHAALRDHVTVVIYPRESQQVTEMFSAACDTVDTRSFVADMLGWGARMIYINYEDKCVRVAVPDFDEEYEYTTDTMPPIPSFYKMATFFPGPDEAEVFAAKVKETYGDRVNPLQNWWCVDIAPAGVNKAEGIRRLCALYGVAEQDVIAVGDNRNDGDMLKAFYSYAMEHGHPDAKGMATRTTANVTDMILRELGGTV